MNQESRIEVIDRDGWRKDYPLQSGIVYIGSAPTNDIVLDSTHGPGVAPLHVQLIANHAGYKLINLADMDIHLGIEGGQVLSPRAVLDLVDGQSFHLGEFTLIFRGGQGGGYSGPRAQPAGSGSIGLSLAMPQARLAPHQSLEGKVTVQNLGGKPGVKFDMELEGMDKECFDIAPGPLLSAGAEKEVLFRLHHRGVKPLAGQWRITIRATAFRDYPGEEATVTQSIEVLPFFRHRLRLLSPDSAAEPQPEESLLAPKAKEGDLAQTREPPPPEPGGPAPESEPAGDWWTATPEAGQSPAEVVRLQAPPAPAGDLEPQAGEPAAGPVASSSQETPPGPTQEDWGWEDEEEPQQRASSQPASLSPKRPSPPVVVGEETGDWGWAEDEAESGRTPVVVGEEAGDWGWAEDEAETGPTGPTGAEEADDWGWEDEAETGRPVVTAPPAGPEQEPPAPPTGDEETWGWTATDEPGQPASLSQTETSPPQVAAAPPAEASGEKETESETPDIAPSSIEPAEPAALTEPAQPAQPSPDRPTAPLPETVSSQIQEDQSPQQPLSSSAAPQTFTPPLPPGAKAGVAESPPPAEPGALPETAVEQTPSEKEAAEGLVSPAAEPGDLPETAVEQTPPPEKEATEGLVSPAVEPGDLPETAVEQTPPAQQPQQAEVSGPTPEGEKKSQAVEESRPSGLARWWRQLVRSLPFSRREPDTKPADSAAGVTQPEAVGADSGAESEQPPVQETPQPEARLETPSPGQAALSEAETAAPEELTALPEASSSFQPETHAPDDEAVVPAAAEPESTSHLEESRRIAAQPEISPPEEQAGPVATTPSVSIPETALPAAEEPAAPVHEKPWPEVEGGPSPPPLDEEKPVGTAAGADETAPEDGWSSSAEDEAAPEEEMGVWWGAETVETGASLPEEKESSPVKDEAVSEAEEREDWWEDETAETGATLPEEKESSPAKDEAVSEAEEREDWWGVETAETGASLPENGEASPADDEKRPEEALTEDWWGAEFETDSLTSLPEEGQVLKLEASEASPERPPAAETESAPASVEAEEEWWAFEDDSRPEKEVIKLKADAPANAEETSSGEKKEKKEKRPEPEEWWAADG